MRILVTGATGFIGARLLARLAAECDEIRILRREGSSLKTIKNIKFEDFVGDVTDQGDVMRATRDCDYVFHVAASVSYWDKEKKEQYETNVIGTRNIVEACLANKVRRLIYTSSIVAIGAPAKGQLADEDAEYNLAPLNISYCDTKHAAEDEVQKGVKRGLDAVIVNPGAVFGPGDMRRHKGHLYGSRVWLNHFYVGGGIATVDVDDVVEGHIRAWKKGRKGERYILANENLTFKEISDVIANVMQKSPLPPPYKGGEGEISKPPPFCKGGLGGISKNRRFKVPTIIVFAIAYLATVFSWLTGTRPVATIPMAEFTRVNLFFSNEKARRELGMQFRPFRDSVERSVEWFKERGNLF